MMQGICSGRQAQLADIKAVEFPEQQEVLNLPFESARLKAQHYHWSERCSKGIQQMLARRQERHEAALQDYLTVRYRTMPLQAKRHSTGNSCLLAVNRCKMQR